MNTHQRLSENRPEWIVLIFTVLGLFLIPSKVSHQKVFFFGQPLVIQTSKTSPARVALHETLDRSFKRPSMFGDDKSPSMNLNQLIAKESVIRGQAIHYKKMKLEPMQLPRESAVKILDDQAFLDRLPAQHRKRLDLAQARSDTLAQDWTIPTIRDAFEEKIAEIKSQTQQAKNSNIFIAAANSDGSWTSEAESKANSTAGVEAGIKPSVASGKQDEFQIQGQITIPESSAGEVAMGPGHFMEVRWIDEGIAKDSGRIDLPTSSYKIAVPQLTGTISAKMFDETGQEVASGQFRLNQNLPKNQLQMASIDIRPRNRISRQYSDFYAHADHKTMMSVANHRKNPSPEVMVGAFAETIQTDSYGTLKVDGLAEGSWSFLRTNAKGFYPTISLASAGDTESSPLFPEKMIKALISIVRDSRGSGIGGETGSIIWGQTKSAFGSGGLQVELEDLPEAKVVYLNELLIPDERLTATSSNGYFAFVDLPRGFYSLRATRGDKQVAVANVEVDDGAVSAVEVREASELHATGIKVYDSFTGSPLGARVSVQNLESAPDVMGYLEIQTPNMNHLNLVHVNPIDTQYAPAMYVQNSNQDYIHLPLVRSDWLLSVRGSLKLSDLPDSGTLIGFVPATGFEVHLTHLPDLDPAQIVYFDAQGQPVPTGVAGGGFVVFNVPAGSHSVLVIPQDSNMAQSKVIPIDSGTLNILKFDF